MVAAAPPTRSQTIAPWELHAKKITDLYLQGPGEPDPPSWVSTRSCRGPRVMVAVNERGRRIGATHHNAWIPDAMIDRMRDRHEQDGVGYRKIAREFNVALTT